MNYGFHLYIDEAGDEGIDQVRPIDTGGSPEYFVLCGVLIRTHRRALILSKFNDIKQQVGLSPSQMLHFRNLSKDHQHVVISEIAKLRLGLVAVVSNKRNVREYRNRRVEAKNMEVVRGGRLRPQNYNWFYNNTFRYMLESASAECAHGTNRAFGTNRPIMVTFSERKGFRYSQTKAYLHKLKLARHGSDYFNNKRTIDWSVVDPSSIDHVRDRAEPLLQIADCVASAVYKAVDEDWFGVAEPAFLEILAPRFIDLGRGNPFGHGFKLLPDGFEGPLSASQQRGLRAVGFRMPDPIP